MKSLFPILLLMSLSTLTFANNSVPVTIITALLGEIKNNELLVKAGTVVYFSGASSYDPDGGGITCYWWWKNGTLMLAGPTYTGIHLETGTIPYGSSTSFTVKLQVMDNENTLSSRTITVYVVDEERNYFVTDHLGNVRATVNQNGDVIGYDDYYPYGQVMPGRSSNTANANDIYKFTGHERDAELGLDYMLARNYDPEIGRFLSVDPLYDKLPSYSPYVYTKNNPINSTDPDGRFPIQVLGAIVGAASEYAGQVLGNKIEGKSWSEALIPSDMGDISTAAGMGALTAGLSALPAFAKIGVVGKALMDGTAATAEGAIKNSTGEIQKENTIGTAVFDFGAGVVASGLNQFGVHVARNKQTTTTNGLNTMVKGEMKNATALQKDAAENYGKGTTSQTAQEASKIFTGEAKNQVTKD